MAGKEENWVAFEDDDEALSLSDLPVLDGEEEKDYHDDDAAKSPDAEDFEFRTVGGGLLLQAAETDMCAADEVFFQGQILPLRPSVSSDPSRCGSRSDSMDRFSSATGSLGFESSRSFSSGRSSGCISRSHSTHSSSNSFSSSANNEQAPRVSTISSNFYAHPSPKPHVCARRKSTSTTATRKSTGGSPGAAGWGLFRLGLVKTPEIELHDLRHRKPSPAHSNNACRSEREARRPISRGGKSTGPKCSESRSDSKPEKKGSRFFGSRLGRCRCSPDDAVDPISSRVVIMRRKKKDEVAISSSNHREKVVCHSRTFEWLAELSVPKAPLA